MQDDALRSIRDRAKALGFARVGVARADEPLTDDFARYAAFVAAGMQGTMGYLAQFREVRRRLDEPSILEGARSVICVADRYAPAEGRSDAGVVDNIARYARGRDYHDHLRGRLRLLARFVRGLGEGVRARPMTDTAPVLERAWAARAGLGFVGKNGLLIVPGEGSFVLLGEVVTTLELVPDVPIGERCGACVRCIEACPTEAFVGPYVLDPRKCISYLTIEHRGPMPDDLRERIGHRLFGCDACQDVCPHNRAERAPAAPEYEPLPRWRHTTLKELAALDDETFCEVTRGSPLRRATHAGLVRNARTALENRPTRCQHPRAAKS